MHETYLSIDLNQPSNQKMSPTENLKLRRSKSIKK